MAVKVKANSEDEVIIYDVALSRIDNNTYQTLEDDLRNVIVEHSQYVIINMSQVDYISSVGIRALISIANSARKKGGDIILTGINERVSVVIDMSGLREMLKIEIAEPSAKRLFLNGYELYGD